MRNNSAVVEGRNNTKVLVNSKIHAVKKGSEDAELMSTRRMIFIYVPLLLTIVANIVYTLYSMTFTGGVGEVSHEVINYANETLHYLLLASIVIVPAITTLVYILLLGRKYTVGCLLYRTYEEDKDF